MDETYSGRFILHAVLLLIQVAAQGNVNDGDLSTFLSKERSVALQGILDNLGASGKNVQGAGSGVVVASPSNDNPNYFYTWTRDAALTMKCLVDAFVNGKRSLEPLIQEYITTSANVQTIDNPSGTFASGAGLGEPKFYVNETAFEGNWGRPQRDGPALRATAMIAYAKTLIAANQTDSVVDVIWPVVQNDLNYVSQYWNDTGFDLWEEVEGSSFWTTAVQHRALVEGANFAHSIGKICSRCESETPFILCFLQNYWNGSSVISNVNLQSQYSRSGIDCNSILTSIHTYDPSTSCDNTTFQPCSSYALSNHQTYVNSFRDIYPLNSGINASTAVAVGRYSEDVYYGGNPWYICTSAAAEQLYSALHQWNNSGNINVDTLSLSFFTALVPDITAGTYTGPSDEYATLTSAVKSYADGFAGIVQKHIMNNGSLSEQFSKYDGFSLSARDLTWSYAAFLTMANARDGILPDSWGADSASDVSGCGSAKVSSVTESYSSPTATGFPSSVSGAISGANGDLLSSTASSASSSISSGAQKQAPFAWMRGEL